MSTANAPARRNGNAPAPVAAGRTVKALLEQSHERLAAVLPKYLTPERVVQVVSTLVYRTPKLQECPPETVLAAVMQAAELGLDLAPAMGEAYLVPFWNGKAGVSECQMQPGYKGLVKLSRQSGDIASIRAEVIRDGEPFVYRYDPDLTLLHEPSVFDTPPVIGVYAVAKLANGERQAAVMSAAQVEAIHHRSQSYRTAQKYQKPEEGPWVTDWDEMAKKTVVKRLCKLLPRSLELARAIEADDSQYESQAQAQASHLDIRPAGQTRTQALATRLRGQLPQPEPAPEPEFQADQGVRRPLRSEAEEDGDASPPEPPKGRDPAGDWTAYLRRVLTEANDAWDVDCKLAGTADRGDWNQLVRHRNEAVNHLVTTAIDQKLINPATVEKLDKPGVRDMESAKDAVDWLYREHHGWMTREVATWLDGRRDQARAALGLSEPMTDDEARALYGPGADG